MFDLYIIFIFISSKVNRTRLKKLSLMRANDLSLINDYMLYKENMTSHKHFKAYFSFK